MQTFQGGSDRTLTPTRPPRDDLDHAVHPHNLTSDLAGALRRQHTHAQAALTGRIRIGRTKRFRIVSDRFRNPRPTHYTRPSIIAGLVNIEAGF